jgi:hypothetical protein
VQFWIPRAFVDWSKANAPIEVFDDADTSDRMFAYPSETLSREVVAFKSVDPPTHTFCCGAAHVFSADEPTAKLNVPVVQASID